jgi:hypothetical protein
LYPARAVSQHSVRLISLLLIGSFGQPFISFLVFMVDADQLLYDLFQAYYDARKHKRNAVNVIKFEMNYEAELFKLHQELVD